MRYLLGALALVFATSAEAQIDKGCYNYSGQNVWTAKQADKLREDIACFKEAKNKADISIANREKRISQLEAQVTTINPSDWLVDVGVIPNSSGGDPVGSWRVILQATDYGYNDAVIYPKIKNGSPHGHSNYGVYGIDENTTSESLLAKWNGGYNALLGSAYWAPWLTRLKDGKIIQYDYISVYYKRRPESDPWCYVEAKNGCIPLVPGIKMIAGYDMKRMGQVQPENQVFDHRCLSVGIHRKTLQEALQDCGGSGEFITSVYFPTCSDKRTDSPDHRSHVAYTYINDQGRSTCPGTHPYSMTAITQQVKYTIEPEDGPVAFSSDIMPGMPTMIAGSTFHADYVYGLRDKLVEGMDRCINKHLSCSDGDMGDGTQLKKPANFGYKANPRLINPPTR